MNTNTLSRRYNFISENRGSKLLAISNLNSLNISYNYRIINGEKRSKNINVNDYIDIKSYTAQGRILDNKKRMSAYTFKENQNNLENDKSEDFVDMKKNEDNSKNNQDGELTLF